MGPIALNNYRRILAQGSPEALRAAETIRKSAHFQIDDDFLDRCAQIAETYPCEEFTDKMPAESVFLECHSPGKEGICFMLGPDTTLPGVVAMSAMTETGAMGFGHWRPRTSQVGLLDTVRAKMGHLTSGEIIKTPEFQEAYFFAHVLSTVCELLCEPRLVERNPMPRADRKRLLREFGEGHMPTTWSRVSWNIGDQTRPARQKSTEGHGKAYHMVRAHWRSYGDRRTPSGEQRPGHDGWWVWIDTHHSGNPAFGVVGHRYDPKLHPEKSANAIRDLIAGRKGRG